MTNPMQPVHHAAANDPVTPADTPSNPAGFASVTPHGRGPAAYDIQAPQANLDGMTSASKSDAMARQPETARLLQSPAGFGAFSITSGSSGGGGEDWPSSIAP